MKTEKKEAQKRGGMLNSDLVLVPADFKHPQETSLQEGLLLAGYLHTRGLLCDKCGFRYAESVNTFHNHCAHCVVRGQQYHPNRKGSDFEIVLCKRLTEWAKSVAGTEPSGDGKTD